MARFLLFMAVVFSLPNLNASTTNEQYFSYIKDFHPLFKSGQELYKKGHFEESKNKFKEAIAHFKETNLIKELAMAHTAVALCLTHAQQWEQTMFHFKESEKLLEKEEDLKTQLVITSAMGFLYGIKGSYLKALEYQKTYLSVSRKINNKENEESGLRSIGRYFTNLSQFDSAKYYLDQALKLSLSLNDPESISLSNAAMGNYYLAIHDYDKAVEWHLKRLTFLDGKNEKDFRLAIANSDIASMLTFTRDWETAKTYATKALKICEELDLKLTKANTLATMASICDNINEPEKVISYYDDAIKEFYQLKRIPFVVRTLQNMGSSFMKHKNYAAADTCLTKSLYLARNHQDPNNEISRTLIKLGQLRLKQKRYPESKKYLLEACESAQVYNDLLSYQRANQALANWYEQKQQPAIAFNHLKIAAQIKDSLFNREKLEIIQENEIKYQVAQKEKVLAQLELENAAKENLLLDATRQKQIYWLGIGLLVITLLLTLKLYQIKRNSNKDLAQKNKIISNSLIEKEVLLKEINHRVKNNLQIVSSMLSLQADKTDDSTTLDILKEGQNRLESMVLIHQHLYQSDNFAQLNSQSYLSELTDSLVQSYHLENVDLKVIKKIEAISLPIDKVISLGLILNELISNALKYAFTNRNQGYLTIDFYQKEEQIFFIVEDDGIGIKPKDFKEESTPLGFQLIEAFTTKLKGIVKVESNKGTKVTINFPYNT